MAEPSSFVVKRFYHCCCSPAVLSSRLVVHGKGPTKMQQALNPAIYEFTCLFPYLILFLKTNPVNKQISYPRLCKTNQLTRDSESKRRHKISNAEFRTCSGFTWKMLGAFLNSVNEWQKIQSETRTQTRNKNKSKPTKQTQTFRSHVAQEQSFSCQ